MLIRYILTFSKILCEAASEAYGWFQIWHQVVLPATHDKWKKEYLKSHGIEFLIFILYSFKKIGPGLHGYHFENKTQPMLFADNAALAG